MGYITYSSDQLLNVNNTMSKCLLSQIVLKRVKELDISRSKPTHRGTKGFKRTCVHIRITVCDRDKHCSRYGYNSTNLHWIKSSKTLLKDTEQLSQFEISQLLSSMRDQCVARQSVYVKLLLTMILTCYSSLKHGFVMI